MMTLKAQVIGLNELLTIIYGTELCLSLLLERLGFTSEQINTLRCQHAEQIVTAHLLLLEEYFTTFRDGERLYHIIKRRFGLDGERPETLEQIGEHFNVSRERIRQLEKKAIKRCKYKRWLRAWEQGLHDITVMVLSNFETNTNVSQNQSLPKPRLTHISKPKPSSEGYIYILTNPAMPELIKIGKCKMTPEMRATQLSKHTGMPFPFSVYYKQYTPFATEAEMLIHAELTEHRVDVLKEFFKLEREVAKRFCDETIQLLDNDPDIFMKTYPNSGKEWTYDEAEQLKKAYTPEASFKDLSLQFGRTPYQLEVFLNSIGVIQTTRYPKAIPQFKGFSSESSSSVKLEKIRQQYPNAYAKWTKEEDDLLIKEYRNSQDIEQLATIFQRKPTAIKARLKKFGFEIDYSVKRY